MVTNTFQRRMPSGGTIHIEDIQDQVELSLMRSGEHKIARDYVIYREQQARKRAAKQALSPATQAAAGNITVVQADGSRAPLDLDRLHTIVSEACFGLSDVSETAILDEALKNLYDGVSQDELSTSLVITARTMIEQEPNYTFVAARLLCDNLRAEALSFLGVADSATQHDMGTLYAKALPAYVEKGVELELLAPKLLEFDLERLGQALLPERDLQFTYLGLQTLYDRYFIHSNNTRIELPQIFFMRVAMGLAARGRRQERQGHRVLRTAVVLRLHELHADPVQRRHPAPAVVLLLPHHGAGQPVRHLRRDPATTPCCPNSPAASATTGHPVRALGAYIKGTNGKSQGVVPFLKVVNDTAVAVNQGGKRKGAVCAYLETWHLDIEEFVELRKNTGDDRRRTHDMNTANWIPDLFMKRVFDGGDWTLFSPNDVPDLHDLYGKAFEERYNQYEEMARTGKLKLFKTVKAENLWRKMLGMLFETGHPVDDLQGSLQPALAAATRGRRALLQPVHRDHAQHQQGRNRRLQPGLGQPAPAHR